MSRFRARSARWASSSARTPTILNAALWQVAERFTEGFAKSLRDKGITNADVYLSQNDGTLMSHGARPPAIRS